MKNIMSVLLLTLTLASLANAETLTGTIGHRPSNSCGAACGNQPAPPQYFLQISPGLEKDINYTDPKIATELANSDSMYVKVTDTPTSLGIHVTKIEIIGPFSPREH